MYTPLYITMLAHSQRREHQRGLPERAIGMTSAQPTPRGNPVPAHALIGAVAGLVGGVAFGFMMQAWDMMPMIAQLVDRTSTGAAWLVHLLISAFVGMTFALLTWHWAARIIPGAVLGLLYGAVWWVLGGLVLLPARLDMDLFVINEVAWKSLAGHLVYGLLLGLAYACMHKIMRPDRTGARSS